MARKSDKRERLVRTAIARIHAQGYSRTTLADVARDAQVPLGNVYYYFKTKESLGEAVVERQQERIEAAIARWDELGSPKERLRKFVEMMTDNRDDLVRSGCPVGSLCSELQKEGGEFADHAAVVFARLLQWLQRQFVLLGREQQSRSDATALLSSLEGATLLSHSLRTASHIDSEAKRLLRWIDEL